jgi:hypothetical protein
VGFYGLLGAALVVVGSFLPWLSSGRKTLSAWSIPVLALIPGGPRQGVPVGPILLLVAIVLLPYLLRRPLPALVRLLLAAVAFNAAGSILIAVLRTGPPMTFGVGVVITLAGAVLLIVGEAGTRRIRRGS